MIRLLTFGILVLFVFPIAANAQEHAAYCGHADSTAALADCLKKHRENAQESLNDTYEKLTAVLEGEDLSMLRDLQTRWLSYRDSECAWEAKKADNPSLEHVYEMSCLSRLTDARAQTLSAVLNDENSKKPREFTDFPRWMNALTKDYSNVYWNYGQRMTVDLNCDSVDEAIMAGVGTARIQPKKDTQKSTEQADMDSNEADHIPFALDAIVAIAGNPVTGRPQTQLFRLPVRSRSEDMNTSACTPSLMLSIIEDGAVPPKPDEGDSSDENEQTETASDKEKTCPVKLKITSSGCPDLFLSWSGKDYVLGGKTDSVASDTDSSQPQTPKK